MTTEVITNTQVQLLHTSTVPESKATASDQPTPSGTRTGTVQSTEVQPHPQSPTTSTAVTPPETASTTLPTTAALGTISPTTGTISPTITTASPTSASSSLGRSTMGTTTSELFSTATPGSSPEVPSLTHKPSSPSVSENSSVMVSATTGSSPVLNHTSSFPESRTEMPTTTTTTSGTPPPPSTHKPISATTPYMSTSAFPDTTKLQPPAESSSTKVSTSTTMASNHSGGILIPVSPRKLPVPTSKSVTPVTKITESPPTTQVQSCSVRHIIKQCLIAVAVLAALATIFMVSTIILCTKLSARKYRVKKPQQATEMMCISALLPERNHNYTRQRNPVTNGVLVIPSGADSDDDGGDNLTLSSFLPDNDRFV
uniref:Selectin P ligand n=2 Tax=Sphaeramia orbicularis TaxID=375764 RepID=A0A672ZTA6_9TELE